MSCGPSKQLLSHDLVFNFVSATIEKADSYFASEDNKVKRVSFNARVLLVVVAVNSDWLYNRVGMSIHDLHNSYVKVLQDIGMNVPNLNDTLKVIDELMCAKMIGTRCELFNTRNIDCNQRVLHFYSYPGCIRGCPDVEPILVKYIDQHEILD